jgi:hypothetical protein
MSTEPWQLPWTFCLKPTVRLLADIRFNDQVTGLEGVFETLAPPGGCQLTFASCCMDSLPSNLVSGIGFEPREVVVVWPRSLGWMLLISSLPVWLFPA